MPAKILAGEVFCCISLPRIVNKEAGSEAYICSEEKKRGGFAIGTFFNRFQVIFFLAQDSAIFLLYLFISLLSGSPLDFFQTPPTTPSQAELTVMALSSAASSDKAQTPPAAGSTTPSTTSPFTEWTQRLSAPSEWAVISVDSVAASETNVSDAAARNEAAVGSPATPVPLPLSRGSPSEPCSNERDSRLEPQATAERAGEEMTLVLLSLMEHYRASLGLTPSTDITTGAVGMPSVITCFVCCFWVFLSVLSLTHQRCLVMRKEAESLCS